MNIDINKKIRKNETYNHSWLLYSDDFEKWKQRFKTKKNWQMKHTRDGFIWYNHNCIRKKIKCKYSKSIDKSCKGKIKIPEKPEHDRVGFYRIELNEDGFEHFISEFEDDDNNGNILIELFKQVNNNNTRELSSLINNVMTNQSQSEEEKKQWDELSKRLMESVTISPSNQVPIIRHEYHPPEVVNVSEGNDRIEWETLKRNNSNLKMVIALSSVGLRLDKEFYYNYRSMISLKFQQIGVHHYFLGGLNAPTPEEQIKFLNEILANVEYDKKKHLFAVSVQTEYNADIDPLTFTTKLTLFVNLLLKNNFMRPIIYCNNNSWKKMIIDSNVPDELFSKLPLWIANYTKNPIPEYPDTWKKRGLKWWMW